MGWFAKAIVAGITAFVATNIDDLVILMLFFAQAKGSFRLRHIVVGQYLGFTVILLASLPGFFGGLIVSKAWIGLLGLVPIAVGISQLVRRNTDTDTDTDDTIQVVSGKSLAVQPLSRSTLAGLLSPQTYQVAAVTFANGGDNISIYVSLFASSDLGNLAVVVCTFFLLTGVWCYVAFRLVRYPAVAAVLARYGERIVPFVLIGLGVFILIENGTAQLLPSLQ